MAGTVELSFAKCKQDKRQIELMNPKTIQVQILTGVSNQQEKSLL